MKVFLDSVRLAEIEAAFRRGCIAGVTVNPSFLRQEAQARPLAHLRKIVELVRPYQVALHVLVMTTDTAKMVEQSETISRELRYPNLVIKVPCGWDELSVVWELHRRGFTVNCTACMTSVQSMMANAAGARCVTLFYGKMSDIGIDAAA